jgi:aldose sugar dehydrogenase
VSLFTLLVACVGVVGAAGSALGQSGRSATDLWAKNCINCHMEDGRGGGAGTQTLLTDELFDQKHDRRFFEAIRDGVKDHGMEAYGSTLSNEQMWSLVVHIRELQRDERRDRLGSPKAIDGVYSSQHHSYKIETVVDKGLRTPWSVDFVTNGAQGMIITNRGGDVMLFRGGKLTKIEGIPASIENGQGGMMEVEVHPDHAKNGWVYLAFADPGETERRRCMTKVVRGKLKADGDKILWTESQDIFKAKPEHYLNTGLHFGVKIAFDPKNPGILFFGIGERGRQEMAQDLTRPNGKIHRVNDDGTIPSDNPFVTTKDAYPSIWSYGHRNPQALTFDTTGNLWDTEHGPRGGDELNLIVKGANYGWPLVSFGINYSDAPFRTPWTDIPESKSDASKWPEVTMPVYRWLPSIGVCGMGLSNSDAFPKWKGDLFAGGLAGVNVDRLRVKVENGVGVLIEREEIMHGMGRVRDVQQGPDGALYVTLNDKDRVVKITPAK